MSTNFNNKALKTRKALLIFLKSSSAPLVVYPKNIDADYEELKKKMELANDNKTQVKSTKTGVSREIPIPSALLPVLASYFALTKGFLLFTNKNNTYHTKSSYKRLCERVMKAWNIALGGDSNFNMLSSVTMYSFRHLRASELMYLTQGDHPTLSILKASELMGHSVNVFLNTYSHVIEKNEQLDKIYDGVTDMLQVTQM